MKHDHADDKRVVAWAWEQLERRFPDPPPALMLALQFAAQAHRGQLRASTGRGSPYISHPVHVALLACDLRAEFQIELARPEVLAQAALLHDTIEDCDVTVQDIREGFGAKVQALVLALTKPQLAAGENAEHRQQRFCAQIQNAGADAVYLKCCDLLHNLADLTDTPQAVLLRATRKGRADYLPLLESLTGVGGPFRSRILEAVSAAEKAASKMAAATSAGSRLESILAIASNRKTELHDAVAMISDAWGSGKALVVRFMPGEAPAVVAGQLDSPLDRGRLLQIRDAISGQGDFARLSPKLFRVSPAPRETTLAYFGCLDRMVGGGEAVLVCAIPITDLDRLDGGLQPAIVMRLVLGASQRSTAIRRSELADEALGLGLEVDLDMALRVGVHRGQLRELAAQRQRCEVACKQVTHEMSLFLADASTQWPLFHRVRIEWRVKSVNSIIRKFTNITYLQWPQFKQLNDVAAVRVVCPTKWHVEAFVHHLVNNQHLRPIESPISRYDVSPTDDGYRGVHVIRIVSSGTSEPPTIPCEVQIRSFLEDSWATFSHTVSYKERKDLHHRNRTSLRELGSQLATVDARIRELFEQFSERNVPAGPSLSNPE